MLVLERHGVGACTLTRLGGEASTSSFCGSAGCSSQPFAKKPRVHSLGGSGELARGLIKPPGLVCMAPVAVDCKCLEGRARKATKPRALVAIAAVHAMVEEHIADLASQERDDVLQVPKERVMGVLERPRNPSDHQSRASLGDELVDGIGRLNFAARSRQVHLQVGQPFRVKRGSQWGRAPATNPGNLSLTSSGRGAAGRREVRISQQRVYEQLIQLSLARRRGEVDHANGCNGFVLVPFPVNPKRIEPNLDHRGGKARTACEDLEGERPRDGPVGGVLQHLGLL